MAGFKHRLPWAMLPSICASVSPSNEITQTQDHRDCCKSLLGSLHSYSVPTTSAVPLTQRWRNGSPCGVCGRSCVLWGAVSVGHQVPGRAEARQGPEETAQALRGVGGGGMSGHWSRLPRSPAGWLSVLLPCLWIWGDPWPRLPKLT